MWSEPCRAARASGRSSPCVSEITPMIRTARVGAGVLTCPAERSSAPVLAPPTRSGIRLEKTPIPSSRGVENISNLLIHFSETHNTRSKDSACQTRPGRPSWRLIKCAAVPLMALVIRAKYLRPLKVNQRRKDHVNMIWHDHERLKIDCPLVRAQGGVHHNGPGPIGKRPSLVSAERQEVWFAVALKMREVATVEGLRHD
jgi:hypothetical protein